VSHESKEDAQAVRTKLDRLRVEAARERRAQRKRERGRSVGSSRTRRRSVLRESAWLVARVAIPVLLPFGILVGGGAWSYRLLGLPTWAALALAALAAATFLSWFGLRLLKTLSARYARQIGMRVAMKLMVPVVVLYSGYALLYLARENAKTDAVRAYYTSLHPLLRIAVSTAVLADPGVVLTDTRRQAADYATMGLPPRERSLHFPQGNGYVHAVDLRTTGRSWARIAVTRAYFTVLGFHVLRHVGTADHLHVSLPPN
jgi:cation transport ATPase